MGIGFRAYVTSENGDGTYSGRITERSTDDLPAGEVLIRVRYSSLNYKDALSASGNKGVTKKYPHTPGIDAAGEVAKCTDGSFREGDMVIVTGYDLGMNTPGGFGEYIRVPSAWVLPLPAGLTMKESMSIGTAGLTAALCADGLLHMGLRGGQIAVTGATGGVGSIALSILAAEGFSPCAVTGKPELEPFLRSIGAASVISSADFTAGSEKPLMKPMWDGGIDVLGGNALASMLKSVKYGGAVSCCGLALSPELPLNVFPFILRGVSLIGIDSVECPKDRRIKAWSRLGGKWKPAGLNELTAETDLGGLDEKIKAMLTGRAAGRTVIKL
ncbi:acryloyl-CoA reductase [Geovibrio thiophilus]|uniref:Acryloyl-CoA reductase n=1 Tax=Geovibrio thiophilus TaxID=139438 RepID=A0A3R5XVS4_9BACT|nr:YhdH/YhfP family quinone oxidoreductase [Geovibrio thiophilus]QAR32319.1 acryloyl-CoA reductase [Geovibrio thiophilus]